MTPSTPNPPPTLPTELWLQILSNIALPDLWHNVRNTTTQFRTYADKVILGDILPYTRLATSLSLGAGSRHRWYDTIGTIHCDFETVLRSPGEERCSWRVVKVTPETWKERALGRWWSAVGKPGEAGAEFFVEGRDTSLGRFKAELLRAEEGRDGVSCDWREVLGCVLGRGSSANSTSLR